MSELRTVAALFVDPRGPYPKMPGVDCWDEARDARLYDGPHPVVAHPPCGPWSRFRVLGNCQQDPSCAPAAFESVRKWGGVLEHPEDSRAFAHCLAPPPGEFPDVFGGRTYSVDQCAYGHACRKDTWIYVVGIEPSIVLAGLLRGGQPTHVLNRDRRLNWRSELPEASKEIRRRTPPAFAEFLVSLARSVQLPSSTGGGR